MWSNAGAAVAVLTAVCLAVQRLTVVAVLRFSLAGTQLVLVEHEWMEG